MLRVLPPPLGGFGAWWDLTAQLPDSGSHPRGGIRRCSGTWLHVPALGESLHLIVVAAGSPRCIVPTLSYSTCVYYWLCLCMVPLLYICAVVEHIGMCFYLVFYVPDRARHYAEFVARSDHSAGALVCRCSLSLVVQLVFYMWLFVVALRLWGISPVAGQVYYEADVTEDRGPRWDGRALEFMTSDTVIPLTS